MTNRTDRRFRPGLEAVEGRALLSNLAPGIAPAHPTTIRAQDAEVTLELTIRNQTRGSVHFEYRYSPNHPVRDYTIRPGETKPFYFTTSNPSRAEFRIKFDSELGSGHDYVDTGLAYGVVFSPSHYSFQYSTTQPNHIKLVRSSPIP